jgi:hypothetical protein
MIDTDEQIRRNAGFAVSRALADLISRLGGSTVVPPARVEP